MQNLVFRKFAIMLGISKLGHISEISDISCVVRFREGTGEILLNFSWQYALTNPVNSSKILQSFRKSMNQSQTDLPTATFIMYIHIYIFASGPIRLYHG